MGVCVNIFKFLVFLFNFLFFVVGVFIIGFGGYLAIHFKNYFDFFATSDLALGMDLSPYVLIILGILVTIISFLGCCGACTDNKCMMYSYGALMALVIIAEIGIVTSFFLFKQEAIDATHKAMDEGMKNYKESGFEGVTDGWDKIQRHLNCCGVVNSTDWNNKPFQSNTKNAPDSCCIVEYDGCGQDLLKPSDVDRVIFRQSIPSKTHTGIKEVGCLTVIDSYIEERKIIVLSIACSIILVQVIAFIGSICLAKKMGDEANEIPPFYS